MKRLITAVTLAAMLLVVTAPSALASDQSTKEAAGWGCGEAVGLPAGHCISPGTVKNFDKIAAKGQTFQLLVFDEEGNFLTAEIATFKASAADRPCPNDPEAAPDYTYWAFIPDVLWVCHHQAG